jgi:hypothetical protein
MCYIYTYTQILSLSPSLSLSLSLTHTHTNEYLKLILPMAFEVLTTMENSGSTMKMDAPSPFEIFATHLRNYTV